MPLAGSAAFGRLCVETIVTGTVEAERRPAAFGRLCVETIKVVTSWDPKTQPPSGSYISVQLRDFLQQRSSENL